MSSRSTSRFDDHASTYVPPLTEHPIAVGQLLQQTSGLPEYSAPADWNRPGTPEDCPALALKEKAAFEPGTDWGYSNTNYPVLGMVIDKASGVDFRTYIERTILRPPRLNDTYWPAPGELSLRGTHARNYRVHPAYPEAGRMDVTELPGYYEFGASGGLVFTPGDLRRVAPTATALPRSRSAAVASTGAMAAICPATQWPAAGPRPAAAP
ncbi:serine hydrolase [Streptomyces sp. NEAU-YJ-81]|uniref:serine hydrolase domain-containing protein n=1 Tax=Streptomyces sp. NEAU-YJ-81 TaxID=2820288 RepID=UPI001FBBF8CF|nr:serine hydrolase domain-containing protein [Streptomyces sp. NEAU-YJ-81]